MNYILAIEVVEAGGFTLAFFSALALGSIVNSLLQRHNIKLQGEQQAGLAKSQGEQAAKLQKRSESAKVAAASELKQKTSKSKKALAQSATGKQSLNFLLQLLPLLMQSGGAVGADESAPDAAVNPAAALGSPAGLEGQAPQSEGLVADPLALGGSSLGGVNPETGVFDGPELDLTV